VHVSVGQARGVVVGLGMPKLIVRNGRQIGGGPGGQKGHRQLGSSSSLPPGGLVGLLLGGLVASVGLPPGGFVALGSGCLVGVAEGPGGRVMNRVPPEVQVTHGHVVDLLIANVDVR
jgi:hypothetical protein